MLREIYEETSIDPPILTFKGFITWSNEQGRDFGGLVLYLAELPMDYEYHAPIKTDEGILDWKEMKWILQTDNIGVASNIPGCLESLLYDDKCYNYHSVFSG